MKTKEEIIDWLKTNMVSMKDMLKICRVLQNMDIIIPSITTFNTTKKSDYSHFIKWLNSSPKTKFSIGDKVIQNTNIQNMDRVFTIQQVKQEYYGNDWHTKYILDDGRIIKESKLSAYQGKQFDIFNNFCKLCMNTPHILKGRNLKFVINRPDIGIYNSTIGGDVADVKMIYTKELGFIVNIKFIPHTELNLKNFDSVEAIIMDEDIDFTN